MMKVWKGIGRLTAPVEQECEVFGYPNRTTDGEAMYENTHFLTEAEAWACVMERAEAAVHIAGEAVGRARKALDEAVGRARKALDEANEKAGAVAEWYAAARLGRARFEFEAEEAKKEGAKR